MKLTYNCFFIINVVLIVLLTPSLRAQNQDREAINQDIKTMEKVLDKILYKDKNPAPRHFSPHNTKGVYIPEFGIIFHVQQNPFEQLRVKIFHNRMKRLKKLKSSFDTLYVKDEEKAEKIKEMKNKIKEGFVLPHKDVDNDMYIVSSITEEDEMIKSKEEIIQKLKEDIFLFFRKYASSLRNLNNNDKIALIIDLENWSDTEEPNFFFTSQINFKVLDQYRKQEIQDVDLKSRVTYAVSEPLGDINSNIEIMNEIINENLEINQYFQRPLYNNGFYFKNFGVIFFLEMPEYAFSPHKYKKYFNEFIYHDQEDMDKKQNDDNDKELKGKISELKDNIFHILATYGHTLQIKPEEYIIMNIDLGDKLLSIASDQPTGIIMKIRKQFLDDYYHGNISKDNLQKKFAVNTYFP